MSGYITSFLETLDEVGNPGYVRSKENANKVLQEAGLYATACLVGSVALTVLGIILTTSVPYGKILGLPILFVSIPLGYFSFNVNQVSKNFLDIVKEPKKYQDLFGLTNSFNKDKVKSKLKEKTFYFDSFIEYGVDKALSKK